MKTDLCKSTLSIGDDYADGSATMRCQLPKGHVGLHKEVYNANSCFVDAEVNEVVITWEKGDEEPTVYITEEEN